MADGGAGFNLHIDLSSAPTLIRFMEDDAFFRGVVGPVGSGKSTGMVGEILAIALQQPPAKDGYRYTRHAVVRNTSPELKTTTIKTWEAILKPELTGIDVRYSSPIRWLWILPPSADGPGIHCEVLFVALDKPKDVRKLLSLELTTAWFNEACEVPKSIIDAMTGRVGRYPSLENTTGDIQLAYIIADTNPPDDEENWFEATRVGDGNGADNDPLRWRFYQQPPAVVEVAPKGDGFESIEPGALGFMFNRDQVIQAAGCYWAVNPGAENLANLRGRGLVYYAQLLKNKRKDWIQRYAQGKCVYVQDGKPVMPEFNREIMVRKLELLPNVPVVAGIDIGGGTLMPAAVFGQRHPRGNWLIHRELACEDFGVDRFADLFVQFYREQFGPLPLEVAWCDPASVARDEIYELVVVEHLRSKHIPAQPAPTNDPGARRASLAAPMGRLLDGKPGIMIDPACKMVIDGLAGKWRMRKLQIPGTERYGEKPEKNKWSHPCEALEYLVSGGGEHFSLKSGASRPLPSFQHTETFVADTGFKVLG
jgi:hypothetical protein